MLVGDQPQSQELDYEGLPFRFRHYFTTSHLASACSLLCCKVVATQWNNTNDNLWTVLSFVSLEEFSSQNFDECLVVGVDLTCPQDPIGVPSTPCFFPIPQDSFAQLQGPIVVGDYCLPCHYISLSCVDGLPMGVSLFPYSRKRDDSITWIVIHRR